MSDRRSFFKGLLGAGAIAVIPAAKVDTPVADRMNYKGYTLLWSGWKDVPNQDYLVGQWTAVVAKKGGGLEVGGGYYASYPGSQGAYWPCQVFDIAVRENQEVVMRALHTDEQMEEFRLEALQRVMHEIDHRQK